MKKLVLLATLFIAIFSIAQKQITLEDIYKNNVFFAKRVFGIRSMKNGIHYTTFSFAPGKDPAIVKYEYKTGNVVDTILKSSVLKVEGEKIPISIESYEFSRDESKILISGGSEHIFRHSSVNNYYIYDLKNKTTTFISKNGKQMHAELSPAGDKIGFVRDRNLFIYDITSGKETQVTNDGETNKISNGASDWVYEEEFGFSKAWFWSPDGSKIAFYRFDESEVKEFVMTKYGTLYPTEYKFKYPKAGEANSKIAIYVYNVSTGKKVTLDLGNDYEYIPRIKWTITSSTLSVQRMNRLQNKLDLLLADTETGKINTILTESSDTYLDISDALIFLPDGKHFIWRSDRSGYNHLYLYSIEGKLVNQITKGNFDVISFYGFDERTQILFYTGTQKSATDKNLFSIKLDGTKSKQLYPGAGTDNADFNSTYSYYILTHSDGNHPPVVALYTSEGKMIRLLEDNATLTKNVSEYSFVKKEFFKIKTSNNLELNAWMIKPANFDATKKYPILMYVYGGPGANTVNNTWDWDLPWYEMLSQKGYIIASVDNRGTGGRGVEFKKCTYKQLGKLEVEDQIDAAKYFGSIDYVDKGRIGIWGWSYGGFMSSLCIMKGSETFKAAIAVAPVTNWRYYDNIYTERYMGLPQDNASGYDDNSPVNHTKELKGKFLLVHGTADDNVHFQNSMELIRSLVESNKQFEFFAYPDKTHGLSGGNTRFHLYNMLTDFILKNL